jgi:hypothetical protein
MASIVGGVSSMQASPFPLWSGNIAPSMAVDMTGVLDMANVPEGLAQRLRERKDLSQTEPGQLAGLH